MGSSGKYLTALFGKLSGLRLEASTRAVSQHPLIVAIHGGTYTSRYFDVPGYSFMSRAHAHGLSILAPDRPGYGDSVQLPDASSTLRGNAEYLTEALGDAWDRYRGAARGIVIVGHSIGAAISMIIASEKPTWPLLGIAISGVGLRTPPGHREAWAALPPTHHVEIPQAFKDQLMFGPPGSFDSHMPAASHIADARAPKAELVDIVSTWHEQVTRVAAGIEVPVHYRQGQFDGLWIVDDMEVRAFRDALIKAPFADAALAPGVGHCIDFHHGSEEFHADQLKFALRCAKRN